MISLCIQQTRNKREETFGVTALERPDEVTSEFDHKTSQAIAGEKNKNFCGKTQPEEKPSG